VFGMVAAGEAPNAIPNRAVIRGSLRTPSLQVWDLLPAALQEALQELLAPTAAQWSLNHVRGVAPVDNAASATRVLAGAAAAVLGRQALSQAEQSWGGDSFGWFTREVPGSYLRLGTHNPDWPERTELHNASFMVDERAIAIAVEILVLAALAGA
jgi:amidohydrolase